MPWLIVVMLLGFGALEANWHNDMMLDRFTGKEAREMNDKQWECWEQLREIHPDLPEWPEWSK